MKVTKAAAVQIRPVLRIQEGTVEKIVRKIHELGRPGGQFATFRESNVAYHSYFSVVQTPLPDLAGTEHLIPTTEIVDTSDDFGGWFARRIAQGKQ
jgi:nitrilase